MDRRIFTLAILLGLALFSGCISGSDTYEGDLTELMLSVDDLPEGYVLENDDAIYVEDMPDELVDWGFDGGLARFFTLTEGDIVSTIGQTVHRYDKDNVDNVLEYAKSIQTDSPDIEEIYDGEYGDGSYILFSDSDQNGAYVIRFFKKDIVVMVFHNGVLESPDLEMLSALANEVEGRI